MDNRAEAILKTLLYSDIFDYPLKKEEIWNFLISSKKFQKEEIMLLLNKKYLNKLIEHKQGYFFLKGRKEIVDKRKIRAAESKIKLTRAKKLIKKIGFIPSVSFIGISGALSMQNSEADDDIDLFIITKTGYIWTTRFFLVIYLIFLNAYRSRTTEDYSNKICLNMMLDEKHLAFGKKDQNLYTAHEIIQLFPVIGKGGIYSEFIGENSWTKNFLPNFQEKKVLYPKKDSVLGKIFVFLFKIVLSEQILKFLQLKYMKKHITKEKINEGYLGFHPFDYRVFVTNAYRKKLKTH